MTKKKPLLNTVNRFQVLASMKDFDDEYQNNVTYDHSKKPLEGNKNKTGQILGDSTHKTGHSDTKSHQASLQFIPSPQKLWIFGQLSSLKILQKPDIHCVIFN